MLRIGSIPMSAPRGDRQPVAKPAGCLEANPTLVFGGRGIDAYDAVKSYTKTILGAFDPF